MSATSAGIAIPPIATALAAGNHALDALSAIAARSPGTRIAGAVSLKQLRSKPQREAPVDSDLDKAVQPLRALPSSVQLAPVPAALPLPPDVPPIAPVLTPPADTSLVPAAAVGNGGGVGGIPLGITVPGGSGGGGGGAPGIITPLSPSIPEPDQWAILVMGFFLLGALQRRRNRREARA